MIETYIWSLKFELYFTYYILLNSICIFHFLLRLAISAQLLGESVDQALNDATKLRGEEKAENKQTLA